MLRTDLDRFAGLEQAIEEAQRLERRASALALPALEANTPWMPFNLFDFAALLFEAVPLIPRPDPETLPRFLAIGAGPGREMILARVFGMSVHGIEILDPLAQLGRDAGLDIEIADAGTWKGYGGFEAIWFNRVIRDRAAEAALEERVFAEMAPGAVLLCANLENRPPESWFIVSDMWGDDPGGLRRGSWAKPYPSAGESWG